MIKLRPSVLNDKEIHYPFEENETLDITVERVVTEKYPNIQDPGIIKKYFGAVHNGTVIEKDFWSSVSVNEDDEILIAPQLKSGDFGQIFKVAAIIAITAGATAAFGPGGFLAIGNSFGVGLAVAAVSTVSTLIFNAIIPPPSPNTGGLGGPSGGESQMYSISGQSNNPKKYGYVPKVYGTHKMFPKLAANPYIQIETDTSTGRLAQYFYAIYDFGFGPNLVEQINIGETSIDNFIDSTFRFVDPNKPAVSEGVWDDQLNTNFLFYKGDNENDGTSSVINEDFSPSIAESEYRFIRQASSNGQGDRQEIILNFICPQGLFSVGTDGSTGSATIDLTIQFRKVGTTTWRSFNNLTYVDDFQSKGGAVPETLLFTTIFDQSGGDVYREDVPTIYLFGATDRWGGLSGRLDSYAVQRLQNAGKNQPENWATYDVKAYLGNQNVIRLEGNVPTGSFVINQGYNVRATVVSAIYNNIQDYTECTLDRNLVYPFRTRYVFRDTAGNILDEMPIREFNNIVNGASPYPINYHTEGFTYEFKVSALGRIRGASTNPVYATFSFTPKVTGQVEIRVTRDRSGQEKSFRVTNSLSMQSLTTRFDRNPINTTKRHTFLEVRIKATNQLNGTLQNLNAQVSSVLDYYDGSTWQKKVTANPAWVFADLLTGEVNPRAISKDRLEADSFLEWANFCDEVPTAPASQTYTQPRFRTNFILDFGTTLKQILQSVGGAAQATLNLVDGKYAVLVDKQKTVPVQIFTPRNSYNFQSQIPYSSDPLGFKVQFIDPTIGWEISERLVYDGLTPPEDLSQLEELNAFGCINAEQAWRFGKYMLAQAKLRRENIKIEVDFEHLVCTRGDYVQITQDVMRVGGTPARVKSVSGTEVTLDDGIPIISGESYGYAYRGANGTIANSTLTVVDSDTFDLNGPMPAVGDLIVIGVIDQIVFDCLVKAIEPNNDLTATLLLMEKADDVYLAESTDQIPEYDPQFNYGTDGTTAPGPVENLEVESVFYFIQGRQYQHYVDLTWDSPQNSGYEAFEVYVDRGNGFTLYSTVRDNEDRYLVNSDFLGVEHFFKVLAVSSNGDKIDINNAASVSATPLPKTTPPSDIEGVFLNITGETLLIDWEPIDDIDVDKYLVRFSPTIDSVWESSIPLATLTFNTTATMTQARTGTYLIKAVDIAGNESANAAKAITHIPELFNLNVIETLNDFPSPAGNRERVIFNNGALILQTTGTGDYYSDGFYYYEDFLDLGEIYSVRLQAAIEAEGFNPDDLMANWLTLSSVIALSNAGSSEWDVETQVRYTDQLNVMAAWPSLDVIDPISEGFQDIWTPWQKFTLGDFTGRIFQFRLRLRSYASDVTPRVFDGRIKADMPDRVDSGENIVSDPLGTEVTFSPAFAGPSPGPNIQITQDDATQGDYYKITGKTLSKFTITFYDSSNVAVSRQFDYVAKGYGRKATAVI